MPKIKYDKMPYERKFSTGEKVVENGFYRPDPNLGETSDIYRGYSTLDLFGLQIDNMVIDTREMKKYAAH